MKQSEHSVSDIHEQVSLYLWTGRLRITYITYTTDAVWIPFIKRCFVPLYFALPLLYSVALWGSPSHVCGRSSWSKDNYLTKHEGFLGIAIKYQSKWIWTLTKSNYCNNSDDNSNIRQMKYRIPPWSIRCTTESVQTLYKRNGTHNKIQELFEKYTHTDLSSMKVCGNL